MMNSRLGIMPFAFEQAQVKNQTYQQGGGTIIGAFSQQRRSFKASMEETANNTRTAEECS